MRGNDEKSSYIFYGCQQRDWEHSFSHSFIHRFICSGSGWILGILWMSWEYALDGRPVHHKAPHTRTHSEQGNLELSFHLPVCFLGDWRNPTQTQGEHAQLQTYQKPRSGSNPGPVRQQRYPLHLHRTQYQGISALNLVASTTRLRLGSRLTLILFIPQQFISPSRILLRSQKNNTESSKLCNICEELAVFQNYH